MKICQPFGPLDAEIMVIGEAPGEQEEGKTPFLGTSGNFLRSPEDGLLTIAGINPNDVFYTNVARVRPQGNKIKQFFANKSQAKKEKISPIGHRFPRSEILSGVFALREEIKRVQPKMIIPVGAVSMWAVTGKDTGSGYEGPTGIDSWRGSMLSLGGPLMEGISLPQVKVCPTYHPAAILRQYSMKNIAIHDLKRAKEFLHKPWPNPCYDFILRPSYKDAVDVLSSVLSELSTRETLLACDLETVWKRHIDCLGLAWSDRDAICIPFYTRMEKSGSYWSIEEETHLILLIRSILTHPNALICGQNYNYDRQYMARCWGFKSKSNIDTMTYHHTIFPDFRKALFFLSSLYCRYHVFWKDEGKERDSHWGEEEFWTYNCKDAVATWECAQALSDIAPPSSILSSLVKERMDLHDPVLRVTLRGIKINEEVRQSFIEDVDHQILLFEEYFQKMVGFNVRSKSKKPWYNSPQQTASLFYDVMGISPVYKRQGGSLGGRTVDDEALPIIASRDPIARDLCYSLQDYRSLRVFRNNFLSAKLEGGRMRCQLDIDGTTTLRFASRKDAFDCGTNLQNIPRNPED